MVTSLCIYRVKPGSEGAFKKLLAKHWPTLKRVGLAADVPSTIYLGAEGDKQRSMTAAIRSFQHAVSARPTTERPS